MLEIHVYLPEMDPYFWGDGALLDQLRRLDPSLILRIFKLIVKPSRMNEYHFYLDEEQGIIYIRWDRYVCWCSRLVLLLLKTGAVRCLILHCCHVVKGNDRYEPRFYANNRSRAFDEIQDVIDDLPNPLATDFVIDSGGKLYSYRARELPPRPLCEFFPTIHANGLWTSRLANGEVCTCCMMACSDIPSRRYSVAVVNPLTAEVDFHWLWAYDHRVTHVPRWPKKHVFRFGSARTDNESESEGSDDDILAYTFASRFA